MPGVDEANTFEMLSKQASKVMQCKHHYTMTSRIKNQNYLETLRNVVEEKIHDAEKI